MTTSSHWGYLSVLLVTGCIGLFGQSAMAGGGGPLVNPLVKGNHLQCYNIIDRANLWGTVVDVRMEQFGQLKDCRILKATEFCAPATKEVVKTGRRVDAHEFNGIEGVYEDYVCYLVRCDRVNREVRKVLDQFGIRDIRLRRPFKLCAPALKLESEVCPEDTTKELFVDNCRYLHHEKELCNKAWQTGRGTGLPTACFYGEKTDGDTGCFGCGPYNEAAGKCANSCDASVAACDDSSRTYIGDTDEEHGCPNHDGDEDACENAWHISRGTLLPTSCFYEGGNCRGCGPNNELSGKCSNTCDDSPLPDCSKDATRAIFTTDCREFDSDEGTCKQAWHISNGTGLATSCFWGENVNGESGCWGCGPHNDLSGLCDNSCDDSTLQTCADTERTTHIRSCRDFEDDEEACNNAWHIGGGTGLPTSCFYGTNFWGETGCWGCGPYNQFDNACENVCAAQ